MERSGEAPGARPGVEELAALDAGALDPARAAEVRAAAAGDPRASAVLDALAATRVDLAALPRPAVPPAVAARWSAALREEVAHDTDRRADTPGPDGPGRRSAGDRWRPRSSRHRLLVAAAAVLAVGAAGALALGSRTPDGAPPVLSAPVDLVAAGRAAIGTTDVGDLADPAHRAACLRAVGVDPGAPLLGGRPVVLDGRPGLLLVLGTGELGRFRFAVVDAGCGPDGGVLLAETTAGG